MRLMSHQHIVNSSQAAVHEDNTRERPDTVNHFMALLSNEKIRRNCTQMDDWMCCLRNSGITIWWDLVSFIMITIVSEGLFYKMGLIASILKLLLSSTTFNGDYSWINFTYKMMLNAFFWWCICLGKTVREKYQDTRPFRHLHSLNKVDSINR